MSCRTIQIIKAVFVLLTVCSAVELRGQHERGNDFGMACVGETFTLFNKESWLPLPDGTNLTSIVWLFVKNETTVEQVIASQDKGMLANISDGYQRFNSTPQAGLRIDNVTVDDAGTYIAVFTAEKTNKTFVTFQHEMLVVIDQADVINLDFSVEIDIEAKIETDTGDWFVALRCGPFRDDINFIPQIVLPSGDKRHLYFLESGNFVFRLYDTALSGIYTCLVDVPCLGSHPQPNATIEIDGALVRARVLQGKLEALEEKIESQTQTINMMGKKLVTFREESGRQGQYFTKHQAEMRRLEQQLYMQQQRNAELEKDNSRLKLFTTRVAFVTRRKKFGSLQPNYPQPLRPNEILLNQGKGFDLETATFNAPVDGTYFFQVTLATGAGPMNRNRSTFFSFWLVVDSGSEKDINVDSNREGGATILTLQTPVRLRKGQKVWVMSNDYEQGYKQFYFSGFLISPLLN